MDEYMLDGHKLDKLRKDIIKFAIDKYFPLKHEEFIDTLVQHYDENKLNRLEFKIQIGLLVIEAKNTNKLEKEKW